MPYNKNPFQKQLGTIKHSILVRGAWRREWIETYEDNSIDAKNDDGTYGYAKYY